MIKLGVNIDHVATLRQTRQASEPDPTWAAVLAELAGADSIVCHLREDRRHIQPRDLAVLRKTVRSRLNLEMSTNDDIVRVALEVKPEQVTLVPERREELTTEGGLDLVANKARVTDVVQSMRSKGIDVSVFVDPERDQIEAARECGAEIVEIHTGHFAAAETSEDARRELARIGMAAMAAKNMKMLVAAGHGLTYNNVRSVALVPEIQELNIGHSIIARAIMIGMTEAVREMRRILWECR